MAIYPTHWSNVLQTDGCIHGSELMSYYESPSDNLNNVRREGSRHFRNKKKEYLTAKINELETDRTRISETCTGASVTLRRVTSLEVM
jgi:hypothetical protein